MFKTILHANDASEGAFKALAYALDLARSNRIELHVVCVEEISEFPETIGEISEETRSAEKRYRNVLKHAHEAEAKHQVKLRTHVVAGHPVLAIVNLADADLLVIGATGHYALHERMIGSRADRLVHLSPCPVLVAK